MSPRPPSGARWLLALVLRGEEGRAFRGDLDERFHGKAEEEGLRAARRWYRTQALNVLLWSVALAADGMRGSSAGIGGEVRSAFRTLRHGPLHAAGVSGTLGLGLAAAMVAFAVTWKVWFSPMPYPDPDRVVRLYEMQPAASSAGATDRDSRRQRFSPGLLHDFRAHSWRTLESVSGVSRGGQIGWSRDGEIEMLSRGSLSHEGFRILGIETLHGRPPASGDEVLLSEAFWRRSFGADPDVVGATMSLGGGARSTRVVGVAPLPPGYPGRVDLVDGTWGGDATTSAGSVDDDRDFRHIEVIARLRPGHTPAEAKEEADAFVAARARVHPEHRGWSTEVVVLADDLIRPFRDLLALFYAAGLVFLLLAVVNVVGFVAARKVEGRRDRLLRLALGASEGRLLRRSLVESLVLTLVGTIPAILAAWWLVAPVRALLPAGIPRLDEVAVTPGLAAAGLSVGIAVGGLLGVAGYLVSRLATPSRGRPAPWQVMGTGGRGALVVGQVALTALVLSAGAAVLHRAVEVNGIDLGFEPEGVSITSTVIDRPERYEVVRTLLEDLQGRGIPAAAAVNAPLTMDEGEVPRFGMQRDAASEEIVYEMHLASMEYFRVMGIDLLAGRPFGPGDGPTSQPVVAVSEEFVRQYFPSGTTVEGAVGQTVAPLPYGSTRPLVVGVVRATRHDGPDAPLVPEIYVPLAQLSTDAVWILLQGDPEAVGGTFAAVADGVDPVLRWSPLMPYTSLLVEWFGPLRVQLLTIGLLSGAGLLLACLGLYSFIAYQVASRRVELGIRRVLGAPGGRLVWNVVAGGLAMAAVGTLLGLVAWYRLLPWVTGFVEGLSEAGSTVPLTVMAVIGGACVLATVGPALRATRVDPAVTLREDV